MNPPNPSHDAIAERAYFKWEREGRPEGRADEFWQEAERELHDNADGREAPPPSDDPLHRESGPEITNMDRALQPNERRAARTQRRVSAGAQAQPSRAEPPEPHFAVLVDRAHLRIYRMDGPEGQVPGVPELIAALDEPAGKRSYVADDSDRAGQFPGSRKPRARGATSAGGTNDERLPMKEERDRKLVQDWAAHISRFLAEHAEASWDFAAGPEMHAQILKELTPAVRGRLRHALSKDLVNTPPTGLRDHFSQPVEAAS